MRIVCLASFLMFSLCVCAFAQEVMVSETDIGAEDPQDPSRLTYIEIKEQEVIQIDRGLRKAIEENQRLQEKNRKIDRQLRMMRGQRNIEANRMNTVTAERDAYKQQNSQIWELKKKFEKDIVDLKAKSADREKELGEKIKILEAQLIQEVQEVERMSDESPAALTMNAVLDDQKKSFDVLMMLDEINQENERFGPDKAKIHYNMGNIFFNQGKHKKAVKEYKQALRFKPHDSKTHFNLAFVSGEYLRDYKTAYKHYRQYLLLNPDADDIILVRGKILEAELHLRVQIPDSSLEVRPKLRNNLYKR